MLGLPSILSLFRNEVNKFNDTRPRILDEIKITLKSHFCRKNVTSLSLCMSKRFPKIYEPLVVYRFIALRYFTPKRNIT